MTFFNVKLNKEQIEAFKRFMLCAYNYGEKVKIVEEEGDEK